MFCVQKAQVRTRAHAHTHTHTHMQLDKSAIMQQLALASLTTPAAAPTSFDPQSPSSTAADSSSTTTTAPPPMTRSRAAAAANVLEAMLLRARSRVGRCGERKTLLS